MALFTSVTAAADIKALTDFSVSITGRIEVGDTEKIAAFLKRQKYAPNTLYLNSPGGAMDEAIRLGELIKVLYVSTEVQANGSCASACFFLFLAGSDRFASPSELLTPGELEKIAALQRQVTSRPPTGVAGFIGLHRPFFPNAPDMHGQQIPMMKRVTAHLEKQLVSRRLIDIMMSRPSNDVYWLKEEDLKEIGRYPPDQEEFLIRKCNFHRNSEDKIIGALRLGDAKKAQDLQQKLDMSNQCRTEIELGQQHAGLKKLKSGWLPSKLRVADPK